MNLKEKLSDAIIFCPVKRMVQERRGKERRKGSGDCYVKENSWKRVRRGDP